MGRLPLRPAALVSKPLRLETLGIRDTAAPEQTPGPDVKHHLAIENVATQRQPPQGRWMYR